MTVSWCLFVWLGFLMDCWWIFLNGFIFGGKFGSLISSPHISKLNNSLPFRILASKKGIKEENWSEIWSLEIVFCHFFVSFLLCLQRSAERERKKIVLYLLKKCLSNIDATNYLWKKVFKWSFPFLMGKQINREKMDDKKGETDGKVNEKFFIGG